MLGLILVVVVLAALGIVILVDIRRTFLDVPDPKSVPGQEMTEVGRAVAALLAQTDKSKLEFKGLCVLKSKLLNRGLTAPLSLKDVQLAYVAVQFQKTDLLNRLSDKGAWASSETLQDYRMSLSYLRKFELKYREGFYVRSEIGEGSFADPNRPNP